MFRFTLDGNVLSDEPEGWQDIISELRRDKEIRGQLLLIDLTLRFNGRSDGYAILKPLIDCQGFCAFSTLSIEQECDGVFVEIYDGIIFYTLVKEFLSPCILECTLKDNSFSAKIDNNKNIEAFVNVGRSKNDEVISAAQQEVVKFFGVVTGNYDPFRAVNVYPVWSCFEFIIDYMTDGEMDFVSDYFGLASVTDGKFMTITTGEQIRVGSTGTIFPFISFQKLFEEVNKKVNISFSIETNASGRKQMRIEPSPYFFNTGTSVTLNNAYGIVKSVNTAELYSRLMIGGETLPYDLGLNDFPTDVPFVGFQEESFTLTSICNIDNTLDLVGEWIADSNIIQDIFSNGNSGYDDNIFFIMADYITTNQAIQTDVFDTGGPPVFYNDFLRNANIAARWFGAVPNSIALYLGPATNAEFQATKTNTQSSGVIVVNPVFQPVTFQDDFTPPNFDSSNNYSPITSEYTVPVTGYFSFFTLLTGTYTANDTDNQLFVTVQLKGFIQVFDAAGNLLSSNSVFDYVTQADHGTTYPYSLSGSAFIHVNATDRVLVMLEAYPVLTSSSYLTLTVEAGSQFGCLNSVTGGGNYQTYNPEDFKAYQYNLKYPITFADYQTIIANPLKQIVVSDGANTITAWIDNMKYHHKEGFAEFVLVNSLVKTVCE